MKLIQKIICALTILGLILWPKFSLASTKEELQGKLQAEKQNELSLYQEQDRIEKDLEMAQKQKEEGLREKTKLQTFLKDARKQERTLLAHTDELKETRNALAKDIYLVMRVDVGLYVLAGSENIPALLEKNSMVQFVLNDKMAEIKKVDADLESAATKRKSLEDAKKQKTKELKAIANSEKKLTNQITNNQQLLLESKTKQLAIEQQILNMDTVGAKNERDFVFWNAAQGEKFTIYGGGTEHGLGMSQYGAKGLAETGLSAETILGHYFQGTSIENKDTAGLNIRVKIAMYGTGKIYGRNGSFSVNGTVIGADGWVEVSDGYFSAYQSSGGKMAEGSFDTLRLNPQGDTIFEVEYKNSSYNKYRGSIEVIAGGPYTINVLGMEDYLKGVVPAEVNPSWPREAVKAQAIAARSYAINHLGGSLFDVDDTTRYQVYLGANVEDWQSNLAVDETAGQTITDNGDVITAYYHSTSGGWTENNEVLWGGTPQSYLRGVSSMLETDSPYWSWQTREYSKDEMSQIFSKDSDTNVGVIQSIKIENRGVSGRVIKVTLTGDLGEKSVTGGTFTYVFNKYSPAQDAAMISTLFGVKAQ